MPHDQGGLVAAPAETEVAEHEVHLVSVSPGPVEGCCRQRLARTGRAGYCGAHEPVYERGLQSELFRIHDVLPGAASTRAKARLRIRTEVDAPCANTVR